MKSGPNDGLPISLKLAANKKDPKNGDNNKDNIPIAPFEYSTCSLFVAQAPLALMIKLTLLVLYEIFSFFYYITGTIRRK